MITVYGIKNCDSVKKVTNFLKTQGVEFSFIDFKKTPVATDVITSWLNHVNLSQLLNTKGTTYKTLKLAEKNLSDQEKIAAMTEYNLLIKRPVVDFDGHIIVGPDLSSYESLLEMKI